MNKDLVEIIFVLDRSGSMSTIKIDTEGGFNTFIEEQKKAAGEVKVSLYQFDDKYETVYEGKPIKDVPALNLVPRNWTALLDAMGKTINNVGARLADTPEEQRPAKVIVVFMTDGGENASKEYTRDSVMKKIKHQEEVYNWNFVFIGANQDAIATAASVGINAKNAMTYTGNALGTTFAYSSLSSSVLRTRSAVSAGDFSTTCEFTDEDRKKQDEAAKT